MELLIKRNQDLVKSSFPVSAAYNSTRYPYPQSTREWGFGLQYEWNGTCDWTNFLSIGAAIQWRKDIGGEERVMDYCHSLAVECVFSWSFSLEVRGWWVGVERGLLRNGVLEWWRMKKDLSQQLWYVTYIHHGSLSGLEADGTGKCGITRYPTSKRFRRYFPTNVLHGEKDVRTQREVHACSSHSPSIKICWQRQYVHDGKWWGRFSAQIWLEVWFSFA